MSCFSAEHFLSQDFFVKQIAENRKIKLSAKLAKKSSTSKFINILMNLSLTPTIYCGRIKLPKMLRLTVAVFYEEDKALTVTVRALNNV